MAATRSVAVLGVLVSIGCASTSMTSVPAPELSGRSFNSILVIANFADLGIRRETELRFANGRTGGSTRFVPSSGVLFPGRQYSQAELADVLREHRIDATLVITPGDAGASAGYVPPTYTSGCTVWTSTGGCQQVTTTTSGGYNYSKPWAQFTAQLYDVHSGRVVWYATATTGGNAYASANTLVRSMAAKTLERLGADRVIR